METADNHKDTLAALDLPTKTVSMFKEEEARVNNALSNGGIDMLAILPGKHLLNIFTRTLGLNNTSELTALVIRSLDRKLLTDDDPILKLGQKLEKALLAYLPPR